MGEQRKHVDVVIVGAGISGIGSAHHLKEQCPERSLVILEGLDHHGGTWHVHRYPGIRSDSDLYTFGYRFKPWTGAPIASAAEIQAYLGEVIDDDGLDEHLRYHHRVETADWDSGTATWTVRGVRTDTDERFCFTTPFLWMCQGYYRHSRGHTPDWPDMDRFAGPIVHPQTWPEDLDLTAKSVLVIGSGATAATLVPAIADSCEHVTMLQRSPTYFITGFNHNELADMLRGLEIPEEWIHEIVRRKTLADQGLLTQLAIDEPELVKQELLNGGARPPGGGLRRREALRAELPPWQQRLAFIPDGDLFAGIASGKASVVTDHLERFTERGVLLESGEELEADVIVTATGFDLSVMGDIAFRVDGEPVDFADTVTWRGMGFTGVPNLIWIMGYFRASWTLRVDLIGDLVCRLLHHLDELGASRFTPRAAPRRARAAAAAVDGPRQLQPRLPDASHAPASQAPRCARVAAHAGLLARATRAPRDRPRRRLPLL
jgi:cation diffusion facilitator CzcD-associated flavoprotein CzcO